MDEHIKDTQKSLNAAGFTDYEGKVLKEDGIQGARTFSAMVKRDKAAAQKGATVPKHDHTFSGTTSQA